MAGISRNSHRGWHRGDPQGMDLCWEGCFLAVSSFKGRVLGGGRGTRQKEVMEIKAEGACEEKQSGRLPRGGGT